jgi:hypothetical protein
MLYKIVEFYTFISSILIFSVISSEWDSQTIWAFLMALLI